MISTRREAMVGLGTLLTLGGRVEAAPSLDRGFEGKQISAGENGPGLPMGSANDALLAYLHLRLPADQLAGKLKLPATEVERRTDALVQEGLARRLPDGRVRPTALVVTRAEQPRFLYAQPGVVRDTADAIGTMFPDVRRRYVALPGFAHVPFSDASLLVLDVWSRSLMVHCPCRNGRMRYGTSSPRERQHDSGNPSSNTNSQESLRVLAKRHGINPKTVAKWRSRSSTADVRPGPKDAHSTVLTLEEEAMIGAFRKHTLLPLDDCLYALQASIPHLTRSSLHRCLQRHDISRLPEVEGDKPKRGKFSTYPIGYFHIDMAELRTEQGKLYMFVAIDRTSKFAFVELYVNCKTATSRDFLLRLIEAVPYKIHTVLTDNGIQFTTPGGGGSAVPLIKEAIATGEHCWAHAFEYACARNDIDHRTTKPKHPWTNGQVERMNRTIKDATVKRFYYETHDQLRQHLANFVTAYNFAKRLKTLKGLTPYEHICKCWTKEPQRFTSDPHHQTPGPNS